MQHPAWGLVVLGALIIAVGLAWLVAPSIPWLGKLPGDIAVEREDVRFHFPVVTCMVVSLLLTGILWLVRFFTRCLITIAFAIVITSPLDLYRDDRSRPPMRIRTMAVVHSAILKLLQQWLPCVLRQLAPVHVLPSRCQRP